MTVSQLHEMSARIKTRRESLGFTQERFAEIIGLSASSYTKIENAFQKPSLDTLLQISDNLNVSLDYLVHGGDKPQSVVSTETVGAILAFVDADKLIHAQEVLNMIVKTKTEKK